MRFYQHEFEGAGVLRMQQSCGDRTTCVSVPVTLKPGSLNKNPCGELNSVYKLFSLHQKPLKSLVWPLGNLGLKTYLGLKARSQWGHLNYLV